VDRANQKRGKHYEKEGTLKIVASASCGSCKSRGKSDPARMQERR
jgi:hypothetical protein